MNLTAYNNKAEALFTRQARNKDDARRQVLNHGFLVMVAYVIYKNKKYSISDVYGGF